MSNAWQIQKTTFFYKRGDTTIFALETKDFQLKEFQLTNDFILRPLTSGISCEKPDFYGQVFLEDSTYQIHGCCVGEFGGSLFFYNKRNKRLYFYNSECVYQVVNYHNSYYVFDNLYTYDYTRISNPEIYKAPQVIGFEGLFWVRSVPVFATA